MHCPILLGCFASGIYVALRFTVLNQIGLPEEGGDPTKKALAVLGLFPIVSYDYSNMEDT